MIRTTSRTLSSAAVTALVAATLLAGAARDSGAQQTTRRPVRRQQPIEIRGQVPTPQVVTVRPREVPQYNRRFLVPNFYDHDFWPAILPGYQLVSRRLITGNARLDSLSARSADSVRMADSAQVALRARAALGTGLFTTPNGTTPNGTTPNGTTPMAPGMPMAPGDTTRRTPTGTTGTTTTPPATAPATGGTPPASRPR